MFGNLGVFASSAPIDGVPSEVAGSFATCSLYHDANLVAHYRLNNEKDLIGNFNLTNNGIVKFSTGKFTNAADFFSNNQIGAKYLSTTGLGIASLDAIGVSGWVNFYSVGAAAQIVFQHSGSDTGRYFQFYWNGTNFSFDSSGVALAFTPSPANPSGAWHHFAFTRQSGGANPIFYWDSLNQGNLGTSGTSTVTTNHFYIGNDTSGNVLNGLVDDVAIFNRELSGTDVLNIFQGT